MPSIEAALPEILGILQGLGKNFALVGGLAVGSWTEPRFTQDLDFVIRVADDQEAEDFIRKARAAGLAVTAILEQQAVGRLATARMFDRRHQLVLDLIFATCGIEPEIVDSAAKIELLAGLSVPVAQIGHLIAMKVLSYEGKSRPQDGIDLVGLLQHADEGQLHLAQIALEQISRRGFHRGQDLGAKFHQFL